MLEAKIQRAIIEELEKQGAYVVKIITANKAGVSDIIACYQGRFLSLEIKTPKGRVAPLQEYHLEKVKKAGGTGEILRSVDELRELLTRLGPTVE